jgi:hypothetical protein
MVIRPLKRREPLSAVLRITSDEIDADFLLGVNCDVMNADTRTRNTRKRSSRSSRQSVHATTCRTRATLQWFKTSEQSSRNMRTTEAIAIRTIDRNALVSHEEIPSCCTSELVKRPLSAKVAAVGC